MLIPFGLQSAQARSKPLSTERAVNMYAVKAPREGKSQVAMYGIPGLVEFADTTETTKIRGMHVFNGTLYAVAGTTLYSVSATGTCTSIGTITGTGYTPMASTRTQMVILGDTTTGYVYDGTTLAAITDTDFGGASWCQFFDTYIIFGTPDSDTFFISGLLDAESYDALDFQVAAGAPDDTKVGIVNHRELWLFGEHTTEVWYNSGDADFPFDRIGGVFIERGIASSECGAIADNTIFWLGDDGIVYRANGYIPTRVSTDEVEYAIGSYTTSDARAFSYTQEGHVFYVLSFPTDGKTWVFDVTTGLWHERSTWNDAHQRWRADSYAHVYGKHLVGDYSDGVIYELDFDTYTDAGGVLMAELVSPPVSNDGKQIFMGEIVLEFEMGVGLTTGQGSEPVAMLSWSDDGGRTWSNEHHLTMGKIGEYRMRAKKVRLGRFRERSFRVRVSDPVKRVFLEAHGTAVSSRA